MSPFALAIFFQYDISRVQFLSISLGASMLKILMYARLSIHNILRYKWPCLLFFFVYLKLSRNAYKLEAIAIVIT